MTMRTAATETIAILAGARSRLYSDPQLTIRQADMRARRLNRAIDRLMLQRQAEGWQLEIRPAVIRIPCTNRMIWE
jgi:hypothetical protein